jgi:hypothetical protein
MASLKLPCIFKISPFALFIILFLVWVVPAISAEDWETEFQIQQNRESAENNSWLNQRQIIDLQIQEQRDRWNTRSIEIENSYQQDRDWNRKTIDGYNDWLRKK